jgi:hypothetical protein
VWGMQHHAFHASCLVSTLCPPPQIDQACTDLDSVNRFAAFRTIADREKARRPLWPPSPLLGVALLIVAPHPLSRLLCCTGGGRARHCRGQHLPRHQQHLRHPGHQVGAAVNQSIVPHPPPPHPHSSTCSLVPRPFVLTSQHRTPLPSPIHRILFDASITPSTRALMLGEQEALPHGNPDLEYDPWCPCHHAPSCVVVA